MPQRPITTTTIVPGYGAISIAEEADVKRQRFVGDETSTAAAVASNRQARPTSSSSAATTRPLPSTSSAFPSSLVPPSEPRTFYRAVENADGSVAVSSSSATTTTTSKSVFFVITNDNSERNLIWLIALKEIFAKQLPKMPKEYIVRLLFDRSHQSLLCLEQDQVVGGITFKPFFEQRFGEIAFCAVSATHQVKGFGTKLMNHLKEYVKRVNLTHFLTYADNFATGYFKKQGFSASISMPKERWNGYIKDYDGGTLMECVINPSVDYFRIPDLIKRQRAFLLQKIAEAKMADHVYPGLSSLLNVKTDRIDDPYTQIPGLKEAGWVKPVLQPSNQSGGPTQVAAIARLLVSGVAAGTELQTALRQVVEQVYQHKEAWPFREPVPASVVDYLEVIKEPIDLSLIRSRVKSHQYPSAGHLRRDLQLMLDNCRTYNSPETPYYKAANVLQKLVDDMFGDIPPVEQRT